MKPIDLNIDLICVMERRATNWTIPSLLYINLTRRTPPLVILNDQETMQLSSLLRAQRSQSLTMQYSVTTEDLLC